MVGLRGVPWSSQSPCPGVFEMLLKRQLKSDVESGRTQNSEFNTIQMIERGSEARLLTSPSPRPHTCPVTSQCWWRPLLNTLRQFCGILSRFASQESQILAILDDST